MHLFPLPLDIAARFINPERVRMITFSPMFAFPVLSFLGTTRDLPTRLRNGFLLALGISLFLTFSGCSGGGGGGGSGGGGGRTDETAVRIVHGAIDQPPVDLSVDSLFLGSSRFSDATDYMPIDDGGHSLALTATNSPTSVVATLTGTFEPDTEYSLVLFGKADNGTFKVSLLPDQIARPEEGFASVRVIHSVANQGPVTVTAGTAVLPETAFGNANGFTTIPAGTTTFTVRNQAGGTLGTATAAVENRGEVTVLVSGDQTLGAFFVTLLTDLD